MDRAIERRSFLRKMGQGLLAAPMATSFIQRLEAQRSTHGVTLSVRDFGATGDGKTKDTAAIQQAIDRCWALGGGEVLVPAGSYLTGAIALRSKPFCVSIRMPQSMVRPTSQTTP